MMTVVSTVGTSQFPKSPGQVGLLLGFIVNCGYTWSKRPWRVRTTSSMPARDERQAQCNSASFFLQRRRKKKKSGCACMWERDTIDCFLTWPVLWVCTHTPAQASERSRQRNNSVDEPSCNRRLIKDAEYEYTLGKMVYLSVKFFQTGFVSSGSWGRRPCIAREKTCRDSHLINMKSRKDTELYGYDTQQKYKAVQNRTTSFSLSPLQKYNHGFFFKKKKQKETWQCIPTSFTTLRMICAPGSSRSWYAIFPV